MEEPPLFIPIFVQPTITNDIIIDTSSSSQSGEPVTFEDGIIIKNGDICLKTNDICMDSGCIVIKSGFIILNSGDILLRKGNIILEDGKIIEMKKENANNI